eukprot:jgi/Tetstr1/458781/TSEL_045165.t1
MDQHVGREEVAHAMGASSPPRVFMRSMQPSTELKELLAEDGGAVGNEEWEAEHLMRRDLGGPEDELEDDDDDYFFETESTVRGKLI